MTNNNDILISIYPTHIDNIKSNKKNFEFRPFNIHSNSSYIKFWVYETKPVSCIKYLLITKRGVKYLPKNTSYGLGNDLFYKYISDGKIAYQILSIQELKTSIDLVQMKSMDTSPPQNFVYLKNKPQLLDLLNNSTLINEISII